MEKDVLQSYEKAFLIAEDAVGFAQKLVKKDMKVLELADTIERRIMDLGGKPAWPVNVSINEIAAHYTPSIGDSLALKEDDLVKIDIGAQVNGYICDRAFTVRINKKSDPLIEASEKALEACLKLIKPGTKIHEISEVCENTVNELGLNVMLSIMPSKVFTAIALISAFGCSKNSRAISSPSSMLYKSIMRSAKKSAGIA